MLSAWLTTDDAAHGHLAEAESVSLLHYKVILPAPYTVFFYPVPFGRKSPSTAHTWRQELCSTSLRIYINDLKFCTGDLSIPLPFIYSIIYLNTNTRISFYTLGCNPTLLNFFCSNCSSFGFWELFQLVSVFFWHNPTALSFEIFLIFWHYKVL